MSRQGNVTRADDRYEEKREMAAIHGTARYDSAVDIAASFAH